MKKVFRIFIFLLYFSSVAGFTYSNQVYQNLFINRGLFTTVKQTTFPCISYNNDSVFKSASQVVNITTSDTLEITIINRDSVVHGFAIKNSLFASVVIAPGDSTVFTFFSGEEKIFIYYDHLSFPSNAYTGLAGMICVNNSSHKKFYWNLKAHQSDFAVKISSGNSVDWKSFQPDYFTVNGLSFPDLQNDSSAVVNANVGDTVLIFVANTGHSLHSLHFHGFHCKTLFSSSSRIAKNSEKDTFPVLRLEGVVLQLVPDKVGRYSVHDHNLVAVSGGNTHPNGMLLIMEIQ